MTIEAEPTLKEVFVVDSEEKVNWVLSLLANLDAEEVRVKVQMQTRMRQIATDRQSLLYQFEADLKAFAAQEIASSKGKRKSVVLMQGTLAFRDVPKSLKVSDEEKAFAFAMAAGITQATRAVLNKEEYRNEALRIMEESGEVLPGVEVTPAHTSFSIRFPKGSEPNE